jgi:hypothetical protein
MAVQNRELNLQVMWLYYIPKWIGKVYAFLTQQSLEGRVVSITIQDCSDANLRGTRLKGRINRLPIHASTTGPNGTTEHGPGTLIIELLAESSPNILKAQWLLVTPQLVGHDSDRLFIMPIAVVLAKIDAPSPSPTASYDHVVAIATLKLEKQY